MALALPPGGAEQQRKQSGDGEGDDQPGGHEDESERGRAPTRRSTREDIDEEAGSEAERARQRGELHPYGAATLPPLDLAGQVIACPV